MHNRQAKQHHGSRCFSSPAETSSTHGRSPPTQSKAAKRTCTSGSIQWDGTRWFNVLQLMDVEAFRVFLGKEHKSAAHGSASRLHARRPFGRSDRKVARLRHRFWFPSFAELLNMSIYRERYRRLRFSHRETVGRGPNLFLVSMGCTSRMHSGGIEASSSMRPS